MSSDAIQQLLFARPPTTPDELWEAVRVLWSVEIPRTRVCPGHSSPFEAFCDGYFGNEGNYSLWYGSRGCVSGDTLITINRATLGRKRPIRQFVHKYRGTRLPDGSVPRGRAFDATIPTYIQRAQGDHARLGQLGNAYESGVKTTYAVTTASGRTIRATAEHPFLVDNQQYVPLGELSTGDQLTINVGKSTKGRTRLRYARDPAKHHPHADRGLYWRHRMVAEARLNGIAYERYLDLINTDPAGLIFLPTDVHVHHLNGNPLDNRMDNLVVLSAEEHHRHHAEAGTLANVLDQIGTDPVVDIRRWGEEPTYDLTMLDAPNNYIANDFVVHNTGKSYMLAILGLTKTALLGINATLLGGSMAQSQNVYEHIDNLMRAKHAPRHAVAKQIQTELSFTEGNWIRPLPASQRTVRGPHPHMTLLDEIDEMDYDVYTAAMGQAMARPNTRGQIVPEITVASSTWQNPVGTFSTVLKHAHKNNLPVHTWCWREVCQPYGWMDPSFIERKRKSVPAEMFRVEYELGEPAGDSRAFDLIKLKDAFVDLAIHEESHRGADDEWVYEAPDKYATYAAGVDWAKSVDNTVMIVVRTDVFPRRVVYCRILNRRSWPYMIEAFNNLVKRYSAVSAHDATGLGNVVHDLVDERTIKVVMMGTDRVKLLTDYITAVEQGMYQLPRANTALWDAHRGTTVDEVFAPGKWNSHLADEVAACAIAHRAATRMASPASGSIIARNPDDPALLGWQKQVNGPSKTTDSIVARSGDVIETEERSEVGVFWL